MASVVDDRRVISPYRKLLLQLSDQLTTEDIDKLKLLCVDLIPRWKAENVSSGLEFFDLLEQDARISEGNVTLLVEMFDTVRRMDMVSQIQTYLQIYCKNDYQNGSGQQGAHVAKTEPQLPVVTKPVQSFDVSGEGSGLEADGGKPLDNDDGQQGVHVAKTEPHAPAVTKPVQSFHVSDEDEVTDGGKEQRSAAVKGPPSAMFCMSPSPAFNLSGQAEASGYPNAGPDKEEEDGEEVAGAARRVKPFNASCLTPDQPLPAPSPARYVDFLECGGYAVKIIGGKHFKTPEGEFVEMKSGVQYKIHATNTHAEGCHLDISIDGYDVGGWVLNGQDELTIERPADEAKKFTFYRVKTAPKEAGIESGRDENGVVRCVFTPEAHIVVSVDVPSLRRSLQIEVPPLATVGDLKRELQRQLNTADDPDQVIVLGNTKLANSSLVRHRLQPPYSENLRLLAAHLEISVEMSSGETFRVKVHPGKSKVRDIMELIENATHVPIADQKLYRRRSRWSDYPDLHLPDELICDPNPKLVAIIPEYLHLNLKSQDGTIDTIKIDPEKTLRDLLKRIPSCQRLAENQSVELMFEGQCLNPYSDRSLQVCNIKTGSTIEIKVKTTCVVKVRLPDDSRTVTITVNPEETFEDLMNKIKKEMSGIELKNVTLAMGDRIFDPERDKAPLKDYGVAHGSFLTVMSGNTQIAAPLQGNSEKELRDREDRLLACTRLLQEQSRSLDEIEASVDRCGIKEQASKLQATKPKKSIFSTIKNKFTFGSSSRPQEPRAPSRRASPPLRRARSSSRPQEPRAPSRRASPFLRRARSSYRPQEPRAPPPRAPFNSITAYENESERTFSGSRPPPKYEGAVNKYGLMPAETSKRSMWSAIKNKCTFGSSSSSSRPPPSPTLSAEAQDMRVTQKDPAWKAGGTTLQGHSRQLFMPAESLKVDPARKVELLLRLVAREDEEVGPFPQDECKPLSTLYPSPVPE